MVFRSCETTTMSREVDINSRIRARAFIWKAMSPTARTSSINSTSGFVAVAIANASRIFIPAE